MINIPLLTNVTTETTGPVIDLPTTAGGEILPLAQLTVKFGGGEGEVVINTGTAPNRIAPIKLVITEDCSFQIPVGAFTSATVRTYNSGNIYVDLGVELTISDIFSGLSIAQGHVTGTSIIHKFGEAPDFDSTDGRVTLWDGADDEHVNQMLYIYSTAADIDSVSSDDASDTQTFEIQGLDINKDEIIQTVTLNGLNRVALTTNLKNVFRVKNIGTTDNAGHIYCYVNTSLTSGIPTDTTKIRAVMQPGHNQTLMAVYTIPNGKTGYLQRVFASTSKANQDAQYIVDVFARKEGQVFQLKNRFALNDQATSICTFDYEVPEKLSEKTDIELRVAIADIGKTKAGVSGGFDIVLIDN